MGRAHKLTPLEVRNLREPGLYGDGLGLLLKVTPGGSKSWIHRYMHKGIDRWMGLGSYPDVTLAEARELAAENRKKLRAGIDPLGERKAEREEDRAEKARAKTFAWCAAQYIDAHKAGWRNPKSADQWANTIATYAAPVIGTMPVSKVDTAHIIEILQPIWTTKTETASRLRGRLENILDWATVHKHRSGENPARLKGHIDTLLPPAAKVKKVKHHAALPYTEMKAFMTTLRQQPGIAAQACEFAILTAARSGEVRGATWGEIDLDAGIWIVPGDRMKMAREHRVPLPASAITILQKLGGQANPAPDALIFPGMKIKEGKQTMLSDMSLTAVLRRMDEDRTRHSLPGWRDRSGEVITMHGFRSTFRDWAAEQTDYPNEMAEMALAHAVGDKVEAAYRRGDMVEKRRAMMQTWADYCTAPAQPIAA